MEKECIWSLKASHAEAPFSDKRKFGNLQLLPLRALRTNLSATSDLNRDIFWNHILTPHYLSGLRAGSGNEDALGFMGTTVGAGEKDRLGTKSSWSTESTGGFPMSSRDMPDSLLSPTSSPPLGAFCYHVFWQNYLCIYMRTAPPALIWTLAVLSQAFCFHIFTCECWEMGRKLRIRQGLEELEKGGKMWKGEEDAEIEVSEIVVIPFRVIDYLGLKTSS